MPHAQFDLSSGTTGRPRRDSEPMRLLLLGDFTGQAAAGRPPLESRRTQRVDIDNFDSVLHRLAPRVNTPAGEVGFQQLEDFHPDGLYVRLDLFKPLREARANPNPSLATNDIGRLLGKPAEADHAAPAAPNNQIDAFIDRIVAPYVVKDTSARDRAHTTALDAAIAERMRMVLHHSEFQSLEAAWRGLHWLVSSLEIDENLQLHLFDVSREEMLRDIVDARGQLAETGLYRALIDRSRDVSDRRTWSALIGLIQFGVSSTDMVLLPWLAVIAAQAGGPLLAGADEALGSEDPALPAEWQTLRRSQAARWIGLGAPRVLLRLPYGTRSDPIEACPFEEFAGEPNHEKLLWGNASLALALLLGRGFTARGWDMEPGDEREIGDLPAYTFIRDGAPQMQACAEHFLTEREVQSLLKGGLIPIASHRDRNAVTVIRFQSISDPAAPLVW